jgi:hypothetical protein
MVGVDQEQASILGTIHMQPLDWKYPKLSIQKSFLFLYLQQLHPQH